MALIGDAQFADARYLDGRSTKHVAPDAQPVGLGQ